MYLFNINILNAFPEQFSLATLIKEREINTFSGTRFHLLIKFPSAIKISVTEESVGPLIDDIINGDKSLSALYKTCNAESVKITAGLRWISDLDKRTINLLGLTLTITGQRTANIDFQHDNLIKPLSEFKLIDDEFAHQLLANIKLTLNEPLPPKQFSQRMFSHPANKNPDYLTLLEKGRNYIRENIPTIKQLSSAKVYAGENSINPAYENLDQINYQLHVNEKRIWLLRNDFIVALGIKNAYQEMWGYYGIHDAFDEHNHPYIDWDDRAGHPSLVTDEAYCGGHIVRKNKHLEVICISGRYERSDLSEEDIIIMEALLALQFQKTFGEQPVVFIPHPKRNTYDSDYFELSAVYGDEQLAGNRYVKQREYTAENIRLILNDIDKNNFKGIFNTGNVREAHIQPGF